MNKGRYMEINCAISKVTIFKDLENIIAGLFSVSSFFKILFSWTQ